MEGKNLYPLSFAPVEVPGGTVLLADMVDPDSLVSGGWLDGNSLGEVMETYMENVVGDNALYFYGRQFPLKVKLLRGNVPVSVCPDDTLAAERYDALGCRRLWYVLKAGRGARLHIGLARDISSTEYYDASLRDEVPSFMNSTVPVPGRAYMVDPGVLAGASGDIEIMEISECSPLEFAFFGEGAVEAMDFVDMKRSAPAESDEGKLSGSEELTVEKIALAEPLKIDNGPAERFSVYVCVRGAASVQVSSVEGTLPYRVYEGGAILVPA